MNPVNSRPQPRLLLLAMSGVRVCDEELLRLGLTLPGFVERSRVIASLPSLGLLTLAARTPGSWEIVYREYDEMPEDAARRIAEEEFTVVAISSLTARIEEAYRLADDLRALRVLVIMGGLHVSAMPEEAAGHADIVVKGEGEMVWGEIIAGIEHQDWRAFYDASKVAGDAHFGFPQPPPRYDLLDINRYNRIPLQTTRGCPLHCEFCAASRTISPWRSKSIAQIGREMDAILALWPRPFVELADDNTFVDKKWSRELACLLAAHPVRWFTESDISLADDRELLRLLAKSGCAQVLIGLESAAQEAMRGLDTRDWKSARHASYRERVRVIQDHGISVNGCFVLGFDTDGPDIFQRTLNFIDMLDLAEVQITLLTAFPGTSLRRRLESEGRLLPEAGWRHHTLFDVTFQPSRMTVDALRSGFRELMSGVYSAERVIRRGAIFKQCLKNRAHE
ncbi:MAG TPA: B12-binding domain-containing radical SAM protein [Verrucomicrobiales bacterium]|nr:B12-binding domain-containing radical SAM protein [Verrucomicrobiales bacterium]HRJ11080.1 cobalamin-dependent protein [Prosthecobacter sp.]HRK16860.1 cobalamin-dependent protein [Prosthecobacter sp.]